jgi:hypothetical protein
MVLVPVPASSTAVDFTLANCRFDAVKYLGVITLLCYTGTGTALIFDFFLLERTASVTYQCCCVSFTDCE